MFDPVAQALHAASSQSASAPALAFVAGVVSSAGPCVAPRFLAVAGLSSGRSRRETVGLACAFVAGLVAVFASFGAVASLLSRAVQFSSDVYLAVAVALAIGGFITLWRDDDTCAHVHAAQQRRGAGGAFLLGGSFALVLSPCCTPLVLGILAYTAASGSVMYASLVLACFALGHALPIFAVALGVNGISTLLERYAIRQAASVVSASLMLCLAGYYAVLA